MILDRYTELGGNMVDTSNLYSLGKSEQIIGRWLAKYVRIVTICISYTAHMNIYKYCPFNVKLEVH
jgi:aryl-alcohol dehydrogenase-like predicted oxidoreductase